METPSNQTHRQILDIAERLFMAQGYRAVRLKDISDELGIKHAALYYYAKSKEDLYMQVMERSLNRHREGLEQAIAAAGADIHSQMLAVGDWLLSQPPMNLGRLDSSDLTALDPVNAQRISNMIYASLSPPIVTAFELQQARGVLAIDDARLATMALLILIDKVHADEAPYMVNKQTIVARLIQMLLYGWLKR